MTPESVMTLGRQALELTLLVAAPPLLAALIIGLVVSIFQAATQINEMTLSFIPKLLGIFVMLPSMISRGITIARLRRRVNELERYSPSQEEPFEIKD